MLKLYGRVKSRAMRPLWLLEELGEPFEWVPADPRSPEALSVSPLGKVPVLVTKDGPVLDSVAQMTFLADRAGRFTHPAGTYARARQDGLTNTVNETLDAVLWAYAKHSFVLPEEQRMPAVKDSLRWQFDRHAAAVEGLLGDGPCLTGEEPVIADFLLAHCCGWAAGLKFDLPGGLRAHMTRMRARPTFRRAVARD
jgi:glutathione S-transferase